MGCAGGGDCRPQGWVSCLDELQGFAEALGAAVGPLGGLQGLLKHLDEGVELAERVAKVSGPLLDVGEERPGVLLRAFDLLLDRILADADAVLQVGFLLVVRHLGSPWGWGVSSAPGPLPVAPIKRPRL